MSGQITEDQHYVPRSYLKNFASVIGTGKKERALVSFYQFDKELLKEEIPTKSICYKSYFYGEDGKIEKDFSIQQNASSHLICLSLYLIHLALVVSVWQWLVFS